MSRNVPKLRFKGFEDEWEVKKFFECVFIKNGQVDPKIEPYKNMIHIGPANIEKNTGRLLDYRTAEQDGVESGKYLFDEKSVIYSKIRPELSKVVYPKFKGICSADTYPLNPINPSLLPEFIYYELLTSRFLKFVLTTSERTKMPKVNRNELSSYNFKIPLLKEQEKIVGFLSRVDSIIEKQEKKVEYWNSYKKGMMQKIFSQKIRFKDENGRDYPKWESKRFKEILIEPKKEKVENPSKMELLTVKLHCKGVEKTGKYPNETKGGRPYYIRNEGELLIGRQNMHNGGIGLVKNECDGNIASNAISSFIIKNSDKDNIKYIYLFLSNSNFYKRIDLLIGGTGQKEISKSELDNLKIQIPLLEEQKKIVKLFSNVDNIIEKENQKLEELKQWKKGLLQQMFV